MATPAEWARSAVSGRSDEETMMRITPVRPIPPIFALICGAGLALAQQPPAAQPDLQTEQQKAQQTPAGKAGAEEGGSHAPSAPQGPFVNGALAVPGAPAETDTVPAKFSAKNAADDQQITVAYTFKTLSDDQRRAIVQALKRTPATPGAPKLTAQVGQVIPSADALPAVPEEVAAKVPQTRGYRYAVTDHGIVLVSTTGGFVVAALPDK
jgi:hypothetical protein